MSKTENKKSSSKKTQLKEETVIEKTTEEKENSQKLETAELRRQIKPHKRLYIGYSARIVLYSILFILFLGISLLSVYKSLDISQEKINNYEENGNLNYRVYLKPNEFYETPYLTSGMTFIARLINNIEVDANYSFIIDENVDVDYNYDIIGKLSINSNDNKKLFEKEYTLVSTKNQKVRNSNTFYISEKLDINYEYYNELANNFKSTFGVDTTSKLDIYVRINKNVSNETKTISINNSNEMVLSIPLSERTIDISLNTNGINTRNSIVQEKNVVLQNIAFIIVAIIFFIGAVSMILKFLELLVLISKKESKYDKFVKKVLTEYDRLIVETETEPDLNESRVIKIRKFQELLDVRDNLKRPIMYYVLSKHQKSYFYIQQENNCYLFVLKAIDLETEKKSKS